MPGIVGATRPAECRVTWVALRLACSLPRNCETPLGMEFDAYRIGGEVLAWALQVAGSVEAGLRGADWDGLGSYAGLLVLAVGLVYAGAHGSLPVSGPGIVWCVC